MEAALQSFFDYLINQGEAILYFVLFISAIFENIFPPIPGDTVTAFGAFLVGKGKLNYFLVYASTTLGSVIGFYILFALARYFGVEFFTHNRIKWLEPSKIEKAKARIGKYGYFAIALNRFFPGIRSVISISAGFIQMRRLPVFFMALASAAAWNLIWIQIGYSLGNNWNTVKSRMTDMVTKYNIIMGILLCFALIIWLGWHIHRWHAKKTKG